MNDPTTITANAGEQATESSEHTTVQELRPPGISAAELERRFSTWPAFAFDRLPWPYLLTVILIALMALGEQLLEYFLEQESVGGPPAISSLRLAVFPVLTVYIFGYFYIMKRAVITSLSELRPAVRVSDDAYGKIARRLVSANPRVEIGLLLASTLVVLILFVGKKSELLNTNSGLPASLPAAIFIVFMYILLGWLLLAVVYKSIHQARALDALARFPLVINVFDPTDLLPFGRLCLIQSLLIIGIVLVPMLLLGTPTMGGYVVIFLSSMSFLALFIPLWGVHQQIIRAHKHTLTAIHGQLQDIHNILMQGLTANPPELKSLTDRTAILMQLRKTVMEAPSWPFKDSAAVVRASIAVSSPMIYFILNELIRAYLLPILSAAKVP